MNSLHALMLSTSLTLAGSGLALAEPPAGAPAGSGPGHEAAFVSAKPSVGTPPPVPGPQGQGIEPRIQQMKQALNLTNEQQGAWQKFETVWREQAKEMQGQRQQMKADAPMTAPERLQQQITLLEQQLVGMKAISVAEQALYQVLTPQQRQIADMTAPGAAGPRPRPMPGAGPMGPMQGGPMPGARPMPGAGPTGPMQGPMSGTQAGSMGK
ncbi:periplasmic protein CpxP/Spy [Gammaproteobacteria bacterium]